MKAVVDATPLIYLAKINRPGLLSCYSEVFIPVAVYKEAVEQGLQRRFLDSKLIERAVENGAFKVQELSKEQEKEARELMKFAQIGCGEAEAIVLAKDLSADLLVDDLVAHGAARSWGLEPLWTTSFILKLYGSKSLPKKKARGIIEDLVRAGYHISGEVLLEIFKILG